MQVHTTLKKASSIATSGLMIGLSLASAQTLGNYPDMFTDDGTITTEIVIGSAGKTADVVGAVNIAASLGQDTITTETRTPSLETQTSSTAGQDYETQIRDSINKDGTITDTYTLDASDIPALTRETVTLDGTDHYVTETITLDKDKIGTTVADSSDEDYIPAGTTVTTLASGAIDLDASYTPGIVANQSVTLFGQDHYITSIEDSTTIELGSQQEHLDLQVGDQIQHNQFMVEIFDIDSDDNQVRITIGEDGEQIDAVTLEEDDTERFGDDDQFMVRADSIFFGDTTDEVVLETVHTQETLEEGEPYPYDERYEVTSIDTTSDTSTLDGITLTSQTETQMLADDEDETELDENQILPLADGDSYTTPLGQAALHHRGLTDEATTNITVGEDYEITYTDANGFRHTIELDMVKDGSPRDLNTLAEDSVIPVLSTESNFLPVTFEAKTDQGSGVWDLTFTYDGTEFTFEDFDTTSDTETISTGYGFDLKVEGESSDEVSIGSEPSSTLTTEYGASLTEGEFVDTNGQSFDASILDTLVDGTIEDLSTEQYSTDDVVGIEDTSNYYPVTITEFSTGSVSTTGGTNHELNLTTEYTASEEQTFDVLQEAEIDTGVLSQTDVGTVDLGDGTTSFGVSLTRNIGFGSDPGDLTSGGATASVETGSITVENDAKSDSSSVGFDEVHVKMITNKSGSSSTVSFFPSSTSMNVELDSEDNEELAAEVYLGPVSSGDLLANYTTNVASTAGNVTIDLSNTANGFGTSSGTNPVNVPIEDEITVTENGVGTDISSSNSDNSESSGISETVDFSWDHSDVDSLTVSVNNDEITTEIGAISSSDDHTFNLGQGLTFDVLVDTALSSGTIVKSLDFATGTDSAAKVTDQYGNTVTSSAGVPAITIENDVSDYDYPNDNINIDYDSENELANITFDQNTPTTKELTDEDDGEQSITTYGTMIDLESASEATITLPEQQRFIDHLVGTVSERNTENNLTYEAVTHADRGDLPDLAGLDTEIQPQETTQDLILVGGPAVNTLVQDLAERDKTRTVEEWRTNHQDEAMIQLVRDAFQVGQHALVVAGYQAEDTRAAARYIGAYNEHQDALKGATEVSLTEEEYPE